jgi:hypothetical protein
MIAAKFSSETFVILSHADEGGDRVVTPWEGTAIIDGRGVFRVKCEDNVWYWSSFDQWIPVD